MLVGRPPPALRRTQLRLSLQRQVAMAGSAPSLTPEQELDLHRRLVDADPVATAELATAYLKPLIASLIKSNSRQISREFIEEAADEALVCLFKNPQGFAAAQSPGRLPLFAYLRLAAQRDLQNILRREQRHWRGREYVELSSLAGNYRGRAEDPSDHIQLQEESAKAEREIFGPVREGLNEGERQALELMRQGERKTEPFARALGILQLPKNEQQVLVKRVKDKLRKRIEREDHGRAS